MPDHLHPSDSIADLKQKLYDRIAILNNEYYSLASINNTNRNCDRLVQICREKYDLHTACMIICEELGI